MLLMLSMQTVKPTLALIVCGDREAKYNSWSNAITYCLKYLQERYIIVRMWHGDCRGIDKIAGYIAHLNNIPVQAVPADWCQGRKAGPMRNKLMLKHLEEIKTDCKLVIAFHPDIHSSRGSANMINQIQKKNITTWIIDGKELVKY